MRSEGFNGVSSGGFISGVSGQCVKADAPLTLLDRITGAEKANQELFAQLGGAQERITRLEQLLVSRVGIAL